MDEKAWQEAYWLRVTRNGTARCLLRSPECDGPIDAHHPVPKARVKHELGWLELAPEDFWQIIYDSRNGVPLCRFHHHLVTVRAIKIPAWQIPVPVFDFAEDYKLEWSLDRDLEH